jgi:WhiB family redox-sensing transcriptional regulator
VTANVNPFEELLSAMARVPILRGARCRGRHQLFDPKGCDEPDDVAQARHAQALRICESCPALQSCEEWCFEKLPAKDRPHGVVAGRIWNPRERKRKTA